MKGIDAERRWVTIDEAYCLIRSHSLTNKASLRAVAEAIVSVVQQARAP